MLYDKESKIISQIKGGNSEIFTEIYDKYVDAIYRFIFFKVSSAQDAEDLTSQVFMKVLEYCLNGNRGIKNLRALLYCTARNSVTDFYRQKSRQDISLNEEIKSEAEDDAALQSGENIEGKVETELNMEKVAEALKKLKEEYREVVILHYLDELSIKEISQILNKSGGATRVLIHRALNALKEIMNKIQ